MKANVNGKKELELLKKGEQFQIDGIKSDVSWEWLGERRLLLREGHDQYEVELVHADVEAKLLTVSIRGNQYEVQLKEDFDLLLEKMGMGPGNSTVLSKIKAPMPGMVLEIFVKTGQQVAKDDPLLILEAMKMENVIKSPRDGEIKSIGVIKGNAIEKNALLIEFQN
ncbi:MAG: biotin carboxyl carrier protein [Flavobacteriales bacterium]|jgi:biotin carboxyl carrier protein